MVMFQLTLEVELSVAWSIPYQDEQDAIDAFVDAYTAYAGDASSTSPITPTAVALGDAAMRGPLVGMSADGAAPAAITAAILAFWTAVAIPGSFGANVSAIPPPHAGLAAKLAATFSTIETDVNAAASNIAADMHSEAIVGGQALYPPPPAGTPVPIL